MPYADRTECQVDTPAPIEPISSVNQNTINVLEDANTALEEALTKLRGAQPSAIAGGKLEKMPERHILGDARRMRDLAGDIFQRTKELHRYIGHDK